MKNLFIIITCIFSVFFIIYGASAQEKQKEGIMELTVKSTAFNNGGMIPEVYTCDGKDISPPLSWSQGPSGTRTYALISDDPDAPMGTWVHWVIYNIPANVTSLEENIPKTEKLQNGAVQGKNDFRRFGYGGPCPPGGTHRYYFRVYALDTVLKEGPGLTKKQLLKSMEGHILAQGELMGKYSR